MWNGWMNWTLIIWSDTAEMLTGGKSNEPKKKHTKDHYFVKKSEVRKYVQNLPALSIVWSDQQRNATCAAVHTVYLQNPFKILPQFNHYILYNIVPIIHLLVSSVWELTLYIHQVWIHCIIVGEWNFGGICILSNSSQYETVALFYYFGKWGDIAVVEGSVWTNQGSTER